MFHLHTVLILCYGGRAIDKFITKDGQFDEIVEHDCIAMSDRGFQI